MKIGIYFGSQTGNTEAAAEAIQSALAAKAPEGVDIANVRTADLASMSGYDVLLLGCPTWNVGELQEDWAERFPDFAGIDFKGKKVALFGCGDQDGYPKNFQDSLGIIGDKVVENGGELYGFWPVDDYDFEMSEGIVDKHFLGLALDDDNEPQKSAARIEGWTAQLLAELGL